VVWTRDLPLDARLTITLVVGALWIGAAVAAFGRVTHALQLQANLLGALREGDYSIRGASGRRGSGVDLVMDEINAIGDTLQRQRVEAVESIALLQSVVGAIDVAVFAFDERERLVLLNKAAERLTGRTESAALGLDTTALGLKGCLEGDTPRLVDLPFGPRGGRLELRRQTFRRDGRPHALLMFADLTQSLREQEQEAWQRIVRVLSHEINNSLAPIKSIAHSIRRMLARVPDVPRAPEIQDGLLLIETRSGTLGRFLRSYAQLAGLPKPQPRRIVLGPIIRRVVDLEPRLPVAVRQGQDVEISADPDQLEQLLINLVRNAVDAATDTNGGVSVGWQEQGGMVQVVIDDEGPGLPDTANLFVPFFTTKPTGSGIGLALSRQIAEAHGGSLTLENRTGVRGCRATLRLPASGRA
jgi:nitrogen fixation/metabolism regulation signal transduction histidine kinase